MRKPGAARLMNWFYQLPPLFFYSSRLEDPDPIIGSANQNMRLPRVEVKAAIIGPNTRRVTVNTTRALLLVGAFAV